MIIPISSNVTVVGGNVKKENQEWVSAVEQAHALQGLPTMSGPVQA
jgi:hypothetical protein